MVTDRPELGIIGRGQLETPGSGENVHRDRPVRKHPTKPEARFRLLAQDGRRANAVDDARKLDSCGGEK
jgi:hypothetical protein